MAISRNKDRSVHMILKIKNLLSNHHLARES